MSSIRAIVNRLREANDAYYNSDTPLMTDAEYDNLREELATLQPDHPLLSEVGAPLAASARRKTALPLWMGSMDKIKNDPAAIARWQATWAGPYSITDKLDGMSGLLVGDRLLQRGTGTEGQDATAMLKYIRGIPRGWARTHRGVAVRGEIILSRMAWDELETRGLVEAGGEGIRRSRVAGVLNAKKPDLAIARLLDFVAYEWIVGDGTGLQPPMEEQRRLLIEAGFFVVSGEVRATLSVEILADILERRKREGPYIIDGLVVQTGSTYTRAVGTNPKYAFAFKRNAASVIVVVKEVEWNESKDSLLKPRVLFDPVEIEGAAISAATGFNARYITDNLIGPGAQIGIVRSGDVIPYITHVVRPAPGGASLPDDTESYEWTDGVDIRALSPSAMTGLVHFFNTLNVPGMGEGIVAKLYKVGFTTVEHFVKAQTEDFMRAEGIKERIAARLYEGIRERWATADAITLIVASNTLGRGFAAKRLAMIAAQIPTIWVNKPTEADLIAVPGVEEKTARALLARWDTMTAFMRTHGLADRLQPVAPAPITGPLTGQSFVFSGFRDAALEQAVQERGGTISSSVSKKTTAVIVKDETSTSTKITRAQELGVPVWTVDVFRRERGL